MTVLRELMTCNRPVAVFEQEGIDILSAETDTSVPASAGTTTLVPAQASTAATESRLSVGEYHALQLKKCAQKKPKPRRPSSRARRCSKPMVACLETMDPASLMSPWRTGKSRPQQPTSSRL
ncbi:hypothetical protein JG688_00018220 [Phytophthora aleatoria]|uniref:Uncharacterized protein n=1 Tax=Phytophthora aleatoria TaxID=2496075 RepID=A0A8J5M0T0_9STRA|nr:hypothetical protein JG688_00018220 [Phytophthora aleatoria]